MKNLKLQMDRVGARLNKIADAYIDGVFDKDTFNDKKQETILEQKRLEEQLSNLSSSEYSTLGCIEQFVEFAKNAYLAYQLANPVEKRSLAKAITSNFTRTQNGVQIKLKPEFELIKNRSKQSMVTRLGLEPSYPSD